MCARVSLVFNDALTARALARLRSDEGHFGGVTPDEGNDTQRWRIDAI
jgi:hypothetical protein